MGRTRSSKTLEDIAKKCGVSISSVSRVLNNEPGVSADTRTLVLQVAEEYNYTPQKRKRPLTRSKLEILVVVPEEEELSVNPFLNIPELVSAISEAFRDEKKKIEIVSIKDFEKIQKEDFYNTDGVLIAYRDISEELRGLMHELDIPYVFLSRCISDENYVVCNSYKGMLKLGHHLIETGHKKIGFLGNSSNLNNQDRHRGYATAILEAGMKYSHDLVYNEESIHSVDAETADFFIQRECDAVVSFNDYMAIRLINELQNVGVKVPEGISVTGFDDSPLRKVYRPLLTTIGQPMYEMGFLASRWLRDNILYKSNRMLKIEVEGQLHEGESVIHR